MRTILFSAVLSFSSFFLVAQTQYLQDVSETQELSQSSVKLFYDGKISKCLENLAKYWPIPQNEIDGLEEKTIKYMNVLDERFGKKIGTLKVNHETIKDVAIRETYLIRYERAAVRLLFTYYKSDMGWTVYSFSWDDSFTEEFKQQ